MLDGQLVWSEGFGYAYLEKKTPACPSTQYRIGPVSQVLTAAAVGQLFENGRLDLDAPIQTYLPDFPEKEGRLTVRALAGHLGGIRDYALLAEVLESRHYPSLQDALPRYANDPLLFPAGTRVSYSNYGYDLLGLAVERAGGAPFVDYIQDHLLGPLGMQHTAPDDTLRSFPDRATFYEDNPRALEPAPYVDYSGRWPSNGYLSTPEDLVWFGASLLDGRVLRPATVDLLFTPPCADCPHAGGRPGVFGLGWELRRDPLGRTYVVQTGTAVGSSATLLLYPAEKLALAFAMNVGTATHPDPQPHAVPLDPTWVAELFLASRELIH
jgi:CubicO group peptidase (beta-lactamase class C family)